MKGKLYTIKIETGGEKAYDEVSFFLSGISCGYNWDEKNVFYFLDIKKEGIAKFNSKKNTIELTNKVEGWIIDAINHLIHQEKIR